MFYDFYSSSYVLKSLEASLLVVDFETIVADEVDITPNNLIVVHFNHVDRALSLRDAVLTRKIDRARVHCDADGSRRNQHENLRPTHLAKLELPMTKKTDRI